MTVTTENTYTGTGSQKLFSFTFEYLNRADVKVGVRTPPATGYALKTYGVDYTFANDTTIEFATAPSNGYGIRIYRETDDETKVATFFPGTPIRSVDLNNDFDQALYLYQEQKRDLAAAYTGSILAGSIGTSQLADGSVTTSKLGTAAVTSAKLDTNISITNLTVPGTSSFTGAATFAGSVSLTSTGAIKLPASTTANRPTASTGMLRFNTTLGKFEGYNGTAWGTVGSGAKGGGADEVFIENDQVVTQNYTITSNKNAVSAGPVTINSGVSVVVPSGSTWVIV